MPIHYFYFNDVTVHFIIANELLQASDEVWNDTFS